MLRLIVGGAWRSRIARMEKIASSAPVPPSRCPVEAFVAETIAIKRALGDHAGKVAVSSTKSMTGHLLGAAGVVEAIFSILAIRDRQAPPTINLSTQDPEIPLRISGEALPLGSGDQLAISNSFGFGGHNAVVAFRSV